jgi:hypothetical protein
MTSEKYIAASLAFLREHRLAHELLSSEEEIGLVAWMAEAFPVARTSALTIDWNRAENPSCVTYQGESEAAKSTRSLVARLNLQDVQVVVMYSNGIRPSIRMTLGAFCVAADVLLAEDMETFVIDRENGWCLDVTLDRACWGKASSHKQVGVNVRAT